MHRGEQVGDLFYFFVGVLAEVPRYTQHAEVTVDDTVNDPRYDFDANSTLDQLIAQQGKGPIGDIQVLHGNFWPEDEPIEDFLSALHEWRGHKRADPAA